jgi:hypothetical protein
LFNPSFCDLFAQAIQMAAQSRREDIRYFLYFLQTHAVADLHAQIAGNPQAMARVVLMFPEINNDAGCLQAFSRVVDSLSLPSASRRRLDSQSNYLGSFMELWADGGLYDGELDRFLQFLRVSMGQGTMAELLVSLADDVDDEARQIAADLNDGRVGMIPARQMPEDAKGNLRTLKATMEARGAYNSAQHAIQTSSSGDSSDASEVEGEDFSEHSFSFFPSKAANE